jgi:hypothetical protein
MMRFRLRTLMIVLAASGIVLGWHVDWVHRRSSARQWIQEHETEGKWSRVDPPDVAEVAADVPWTLRVLGERRLYYIKLDGNKLTKADIPRIDWLKRLFPECSDILIYDHGWATNRLWRMERPQ